MGQNCHMDFDNIYGNKLWCINLALIRYDERDRGISATSQWQKVMDSHFDDGRMERIYPKAKSRNREIRIQNIKYNRE